MYAIFQHQSQQIKNLKMDIAEMREDLTAIRQSEENLSHKGMLKISKITKEIKTELNETKKLKTDVSTLKKDITGIKQSHEDLSKKGMETLSKFNDDFKSEVKQIKSEMKSVKKDLVSVKEALKKRHESSDRESTDQIELETEKPKSSNKRSSRNNSYREPKVPPTILELFNSSEEENEKKVDGATASDIDNADSNSKKNSVQSNGELQSFDNQKFEDNNIRDFNDDHIRKIIFSSQESSDYHHESSEYHESDAVSDDEEEKNHHFDKDYNFKRIFSKKFLYK